MLERGESTLDYIIITPLRIREYLISKVITLTSLALLTGTAISAMSPLSGFNVPLLVTGIALTSVLFILIGFMAVARFRTVNEYMLTSLLYISVFCLPILDYFGLYRSWVFYLLPTQASLVLIRGAFELPAAWLILYSISYLIICIAAAFPFAYRAFYRFIVLKEGER
ncbi:MAG: hypothetical protein HPY66_2888 [Firmicutes bacterium]|nr:hypothetical protein [Bacillota bacterium]